MNGGPPSQSVAVSRDATASRRRETFLCVCCTRPYFATRRGSGMLIEASVVNVTSVSPTLCALGRKLCLERARLLFPVAVLPAARLAASTQGLPA